MTDENPHPESQEAKPIAEQMPRAELERRCLSALEKDKNAVLSAVSIGVNASSFASPICGQLFDLMAVAVQTGSVGDPGDEVCLQILKLQAKAPLGMQEWFAIQALESTSAYARRHVDQVMAYWKRDQLLNFLKRAYHAVNAHTVPDWNLCLEDATKYLSQINDLASDSRATTLPAMVDSYVADQLDPFRAKVTPIGLTDWDRGAGSLREGELVTLAARPGMGKTALAIQIASSVINRGHVCAFFSLEMTGKELVGRLALHRSGRDGYGNHPHEQAKRIATAEELKKADKLLYVYEEKSSRTVAAIEARCRLLAASKNGLSIAIVDYLQLIQVAPDMRRANREQQVADLTRRLKLLAIEIKCPVVILAQLNRSTETDKPRRPRFSDLRESGAIEQDSDRVWFAYSPHDEDSTIQLPAPDDEIIPVRLLQAKCRGGCPGVAKDLSFDRPISKLTQISKTAAQ
jgi:replicative DNA helicase